MSFMPSGWNVALTNCRKGKPLGRSKAGVSLVANIILSKYVEHTPLHRLIQRFARSGLQIPPATMGLWTKNGIDLLLLLYQLYECPQRSAVMPVHNPQKPLKINFISISRRRNDGLFPKPEAESRGRSPELSAAMPDHNPQKPLTINLLSMSRRRNDGLFPKSRSEILRADALHNPPPRNPNQP